jgi:hypothetical protein
MTRIEPGHGVLKEKNSKNGIIPSCYLMALMLLY